MRERLTGALGGVFGSGERPRDEVARAVELLVVAADDQEFAGLEPLLGAGAVDLLVTAHRREHRRARPRPELDLGEGLPARRAVRSDEERVHGGVREDLADDGEVALLGGLVQVRGGYQELFLDDSPRSFTLGGGLNYGFGSLDLTADYAYEAFEFFDGVNRISFALGF